uniref:Protein SEY1 homolog n=1 Tax=Arcella intermedia TaxID=1963864 RepID=A0A6B2KXY6_9EUKA
MSSVSSEPVPPVQIVTGEGTYNVDVSQELRNWNFDKQGLDYYLVAVLGCQSSGKSTLLNLLFGTNFQVLDVSKTKVRQQTTLGIWLGNSLQNNKSILVLDVEGTDSKERGEDHASWERKTSLFSLALSEVLLLNLWANDVGRFEGANYGLLKIVFELNLKLFYTDKRNKTLILIVFRDYDEETHGTIQDLGKTVSTDIENLWLKMTKAEKFNTSSIYDFFDIQYVGLAAKVNKVQFAEDVNKLKLRFFDEEQTLLTKKYKSEIPADGFTEYASRIWDTILQEKDLDIPSQKIMLSIYRCDEIAKKAYASFESALVGMKTALNNSQIMENFAATGKALVDKALGEYDGASMYYAENVVKDKKKELETQMEHQLQVLFASQAKLISTKWKNKFDEIFREQFKHPTPNLKYRKIVNDLKKPVIESYDNEIAEATIKEYDWSITINSEREEFLRHIEFNIQLGLQKQLELFSNKILNHIIQEFDVEFMKLFDAPQIPLWCTITAVYQKEYEKGKEEWADTLGALQVKDISKEMTVFEIKSSGKLYTYFKEKTADPYLMLMQKFSSKFEYGEDGTIRSWHASDNVKEIWRQAKLYAEKYLDFFSIFRLDESDQELHFYEVKGSGIELVSQLPKVEESKILISKKDCEKNLRIFRTQIQSPLRGALKEVENSKAHQKVPAYFIVLFMFFAADEVLSFFFFSPVLFFLTVTAVVLLYKFGMMAAAADYVEAQVTRITKDFIYTKVFNLPVASPVVPRKPTWESRPKAHPEESKQMEESRPSEELSVGQEEEMYESLPPPVDDELSSKKKND